jgi:hypothetical protein
MKSLNQVYKTYSKMVRLYNYIGIETFIVNLAAKVLKKKPEDITDKGKRRIK